MGGSVRVIGADSRANSSAAEDSLVATDGPARLYAAVMYNDAATDVYFQVFDAASLPADTTVPVLTQKVTAGNTASYDFGDGVPFSTGIVVALSTTDTTLTVGTGDEALFCVTYRPRIR